MMLLVLGCHWRWTDLLSVNTPVVAAPQVGVVHEALVGFVCAFCGSIDRLENPWEQRLLSYIFTIQVVGTAE